MINAWRERVKQFDQTLQTRLDQADTAQERATLRFAYLWLQQIAGEAAERRVGSQTHLIARSQTEFGNAFTLRVARKK